MNCETQKELQFEKLKRQKLTTNYCKSLRAVYITEGLLAVSFVGLNTASVVFLTTVVPSPAVAVIEAGLLFIPGGLITRNMNPRVVKHEKIKLLAAEKLNIISELISKAVVDENISDEK